MSMNLFEKLDNDAVREQLMAEIKSCIHKSFTHEVLKAVIELRQISKQLTNITTLLIEMRQS